MNEHYLEWLFLREHLDYWIEQKYLGQDLVDRDFEYMVYSFQGKEYDIDKMKERYIELTKQLLKDYEL